jgi:hypothetical protein
MHAHRAVRASVVAAVVVVVLIAVPNLAGSQNLPLAQLLPDLILRDITLERGTVGPPHQAHFSPLENDLSNPVIGIVESFNTQLATQFATFPLGSSTGGLTYVFDESVGTFRRGSASFGPLFAERALTIGRRKLSAGFNYQRTSYRTFEGQDLDNGSIKFYLRHQDCCTFNLLPNPPYSEFSLVPNGTRLTVPFEGDIIEASLAMKATTNTTALFANYGLTNRWDIGLAVPFVSVDLEASVTANIIRLVTATAPTVHTFDLNNPAATQTRRRTGSATGIGDVVLRTKYRFLDTGGGGLAAGVDLRLPTGDEDELLGTGGTQVKFLGIVSTEHGRFGQHVNLGYTVAEGHVAGTATALSPASIPDEFNYAGGVEYVATPRFTLMADIVGRTLRRVDRLTIASKRFEYSAIPPGLFNPTAQELVEAGFLTLPSTSSSFDEFDPRPGSLMLLLGTGGFKWNPFGNLLISGSVLFPLTDAGLRSKITTTFGVDCVF